jgi:hypothetical protein
MQDNFSGVKLLDNTGRRAIQTDKLYKNNQHSVENYLLLKHKLMPILALPTHLFLSSLINIDILI